MPEISDEPDSGGMSTEYDDLTRLVRNGVKPEGPKERLQLAADKLAGNVPLGVGARNKLPRKGISGSAELLALLKYGLLGLLLVVFGRKQVLRSFSFPVQFSSTPRTTSSISWTS